MKIRGFRVEPAEVTALLLAHPAVRAAAVVARRDPASGGQRLVGYVVGSAVSDGAALDLDRLRRYLAERLPEPMVPAALVELPALPVAASGKLDRSALPEPEQVEAMGADAPRGALAEVVAAIWADVLGRDRVGAHEDFFRLGGESMRAAQVVFRLSRALGVDLPVQALFESPTVQGLADRIAALRAGGGEAGEVPPLRRREAAENGELPLSFAQERLWILDQLEPGTTAFHIPVALRLTGELDADALERALQEIVRRHAPLRAAFEAVDGKPRQVLRDVGAPVLRRVDLRSLTEEAREHEVERLLRDEIARPFDLSGEDGGALVRGFLVQTAAAEHVVVLTLHHVASDGWSSGILVREAAALYAAFAAGQPSPLDELPIEYADFAAWQRQWLGSGAMASQVAYWRQQLAGLPPLELPGDRPRPAAQSYRGRHLPFALSSETTRDLERLGRKHGASLFMVLLAGFEALLARYSGQRDFGIGVPVAGRTRSEVADLIGCFVNVLVLRADLVGDSAGDPTFAELLARVRRTALDAYAHQDAPFERLLDELQVERDRSRSPLFQVGFTLENVPVEALALPGIAATALPLESGTAKYDLSLSLAEEPEGMRGTLEYAVDLFDEPTMQRLLGCYRTLLEAVAAGAVTERVSRLPLLAPAERDALLHEWNETPAVAVIAANAVEASVAADAVAVGTVADAIARVAGDAVAAADSAAGIAADAGLRRPSLYEAFVAHARRDPAATALLFGDERWSYSELDTVVAGLAAQLVAAGVGADDVVAICLDRSPAQIAAVLAVLAAGGAFLPLDPELPRERLAFMLADSGARLLLTHSTLCAKMPAAASAATAAATAERPAVLCLDELAATAAFARRGEAERAAAIAIDAGIAAGRVGAAADPEAAAYVIYTSGSTGQPKGVVVRRAGLANLLAAQVRAFGLGPDDRVLQFASPSFDASVWEIAMAFGAGAALVLADRATLADAAALGVLLDAAAVTAATLPPTMLAVLADSPAPLPSLRLLVSAGEACDATLVRCFAAPGRTFVNAYGPTETTVCATLAACAPAEVPPPIGRPLLGARVYVLDGELEPVPIGVPGEIFVGGPLLARGYLGRPRATAERFVPDPFSAAPGSRLYATGDRGRLLADGNLQYLGRTDQQVKVRGHRVELGEVEAALRRHSAVREAVVVQRQIGGGDGSHLALVAYVAAGDDASGAAAPSLAELRAHLAELLPEAMIPARFVMLASLPLTTAGKVDRRALPELDSGVAVAAAGDAAPCTPLESSLREIWSAVLGLQQVSLDDNFFELGGDSILAIQVASRAQRAGIPLQPRHIFEHQTVRELARALSVEAENSAARLPLEATNGQQAAVDDRLPVDASDGHHPAAMSGHHAVAVEDGLDVVAAGEGSAASEGAVATAGFEVAVPLLPIQRWFFAGEPLDLHHWNQAVLLALRRPMAESTLVGCLRALVERHDALRLRFRRLGEAGAAWRQTVVPAAQAAIALEVVDLASLPADEQRSELERRAAHRQATLDLAEGPLFAAVLFRLGSGGDRLLLVAHHLVVDAVSWRILVEELALAVEQVDAGRPIALGLVGTRFVDWAVAVARSEGSFVSEPHARWDDDAPSSLPLDHRLGANTVASRQRLAIELDRERTRRLLSAARATSGHGRSPVEVFLLAALAAALRRWTGSALHAVDIEGHGRAAAVDGLDPSRTVGWLTSLHTLSLRSDAEWTAEEALKHVEWRLRELSEPFASWVGSPHDDRMSRPAIAFNYFGRVDRALAADGPFAADDEHDVGPTASPRSLRTHLLEVEAAVRGAGLELVWSYSENLHRPETIATLAASLRDELTSLIDASSTLTAGAVATVSTAMPARDVFDMVSLAAPPPEVAAVDAMSLATLAPGVEAVVPLSPMQEGMLFLSLQNADSDAYIGQVSCLIPGDVDVEALEAAWQRVGARHQALRTALAWEGLERPVQVVRRDVSLAFERLDWRHLAADEEEARLQALLLAERRRGFDLRRAPLVRALWVALPAAPDGAPRHRFVFTLHHVAVDGWSMSVLLAELFQVYRELAAGRQPDLPPAPAFSDYVAWLEGRDRGAAADFWRRYLAGFRSPTPLGLSRRLRAADAPSSGPRDYRSERVSLSPATSAALAAFARRQRLTVNTLVQGAVALAAAPLRRRGGRPLRRHHGRPAGGAARRRAGGRAFPQHAAAARHGRRAARPPRLAARAAGAAGGGPPLRGDAAGRDPGARRARPRHAAVRDPAGVRELSARSGARRRRRRTVRDRRRAHERRDSLSAHRRRCAR